MLQTGHFLRKCNKLLSNAIELLQILLKIISCKMFLVKKFSVSYGNIFLVENEASICCMNNRAFIVLKNVFISYWRNISAQDIRSMIRYHVSFLYKFLSVHCTPSKIMFCMIYGIKTLWCVVCFVKQIARERNLYINTIRLTVKFKRK